MSNADKPAFSQSFAADKDGNMFSAIEKDLTNGGLTKRELIAKDILSAIVSKPGSLAQSEIDTLVPTAIHLTDELLKQLEK